MNMQIMHESKVLKNTVYLRSRHYHMNNFKTNMLLLLGLWISNSIIGCNSSPVPDADYSSNIALEFGAPLIHPLGDQITLDAQTNYTLRCEADEPIIWHMPTNLITYSETPYDTGDKHRPFGSWLILNNIDYNNVGTYYCIKKTKVNADDVANMHEQLLNELLESNAANQIYVFVNDPDNLLAPIHTHVGTAVQYSDIVVPCKPTRPDVEVLLTTPNDETFSSNEFMRYDPRRGFVIKVLALGDCGLFICRPAEPLEQYEDEEQSYEVHFMNGYTAKVNTPKITSATRGHAFVGQEFKLVCDVVMEQDIFVTIDWVIPETVVDHERITKLKTERITHNNTNYIGRSVLIVQNAQRSDEGKYRCNVRDHANNTSHNTYVMTILEEGEDYIQLLEPHGVYNIADKANKTICINVKYRGFPWPKLTWRKPDNTIIQASSEKYNITETDDNTMLTIYNAQMPESGIYKITADNDLVNKTLEFTVTISDRPIVKVDDVFVRPNEEAHLTCQVISHEQALVTWLFTPCSINPRWPICESKFDQTFNSTRSARPGNNNLEYMHDLYFMPTQSGIMRCIAKNRVGTQQARAHVFIDDIGKNFTITGIDEDTKIGRDDEVNITCRALGYFYANDLVWFKDNDELMETDNIALINDSTDYSYNKILQFKSIQHADSGTYECRARQSYHHNWEEARIVQVKVYDPYKPRIMYTNLDAKNKMKGKLGESMNLTCSSNAIPAAKLLWYKDEIPLVNTDNIDMDDENITITIRSLKPEDEGVYSCVAENRLGSAEASASVVITNLPGLKLGWILSIVILILLLLLVIIYLVVQIRRKRKLLRELKEAGLANFEEGAVEHINPALTLDEQADLLPYDRHFEFPRDKLKLGKQLGAGAFGVVLKAHAEGIKPDERESTVAVKMVKRQADNEVMRALVSELKIMVHLGQHLNVVNLLGAVTKNIAKRELMVIVEYCRYGNLQNFLLKNRKRFIDQINPNTGKIDPSITTQRFSDNFELHRDGIKYVNLTFPNHQYINHMNNVNNNFTRTINNRRDSDSDPRSGTRAGRPNSKSYLRQSDLYERQLDTGATEQTVMTTIPEDEDLMSNNSVQPAWRTNYKSDSTEAMVITTSDLVSWAFQVARGMDYLASKKVLHGDLAARNILLCEDNVVKICDFGLARSMYKGDNYKKHGEAPLPIKWLALESLSDHVFSTYTDVWSFGIVLWEFFSLAKVPYPGMDPNQSLFLKLKDGYRMEKPPFANDELYDIMLECWSTNPECRPLFNVLEKRFAKMLGDEVTNHYMDLNDPYLRVNTEFEKRNQTDYLALMGSPDEMAPPPPRYVNGHILPEIRIDPSYSDDYLQVSTDNGIAIFSPTRPNEDDKAADSQATTTSFTFPDTSKHHSPTLSNNLDSPVNKKRNKELVQPEEIPMLHNANADSDGENNAEVIPQLSKVLQQTRGIPTPSPRHHIETQLNGSGDENYVNVMKSPKKLLNNNNNSNQRGNASGRATDAFSNPSYHILQTVKDSGK